MTSRDTEILSLQNQLATGAYLELFPIFLKVHNHPQSLERGSIVSEVSTGVKTTMHEEFKELQFQLLTNTKKELKADLTRFDPF